MNTQQQIVPINKDYVHKTNAENVLISELIQHGDEFHSFICVNTNHPFFFDHSREHIPGIMLIEAGRQKAMAIVHKYYEVSFDKVFFINDFQMKFFSFAQTSLPVVIKSKVFRDDSKSKNYFQFVLESSFHQNSHLVATVHGAFTVLSARMLARLERSRA
jgi:2-oxo-3-(phosphooxy)propyl 3-oxoalkanoate synthase